MSFSSQASSGKKATVLIVDDDSSITASLALLLKQNGYRAEKASDPQEALQRLDTEAGAGADAGAGNAGPAVDLVLQDMNFSRSTSGEEGLRLLGEIRSRYAMPVILMTAWGTIDLAVRGIKAGAFDFVTKPWRNETLLATIATALDVARAHAGGVVPSSQIRPAAGPGISRSGTDSARADGATPRHADRKELDRRYDFSGLIGEDPSLVELLDLVSRIAPTDASVLITGESGTGKEELAEAIHRNSRRASGPFVKVNLGGVSQTLFESEMFGHIRGAFTDARSDRRGRFDIADGGTIFLDEIGELEAPSQVKLLRVLQDRRFEVLGSSQTRQVDVRVVSATNRKLSEMVERGSFREDLLYRLNLITFELPPLRERPGDIPLLAKHFLDRAATLYGRKDLELGDSALEWLVDQRWPGNVRQLKQAVERAVLIGRSQCLEAEDLLEPGGETVVDKRSLPAPGSMTLAEMERGMIEKCLVRFKGNISQSARALGLSRAALYRRFSRYGIEPEDYLEEGS